MLRFSMLASRRDRGAIIIIIMIMIVISHSLSAVPPRALAPPFSGTRFLSILSYAPRRHNRWTINLFPYATAWGECLTPQHKM